MHVQIGCRHQIVVEDIARDGLIHKAHVQLHQAKVMVTEVMVETVLADHLTVEVLAEAVVDLVVAVVVSVAVEAVVE